MKGQNIGYRRVSSTDQSTGRQLVDVDLDQVFEDKASGASADRPELQACLRMCRKGDVLHVHSIDRLARNLADLQEIVGDLVSRGVTVRFHKEGLVFSGTADPMSKLLLQTMGAFAEFERSMIRERQREGIQAAKRAGKHVGRPSKLSSSQIEMIQAKRKGGMSVSALAQEYGVSRQTVYTIVGGK